MSLRRTHAVTRRRAALLLAASPLAAQVVSKVPPQGAPAPAAPATPQQGLEKAHADVRKVSERLASLEVPTSLEPAFSFRP